MSLPMSLDPLSCFFSCTISIASGGYDFFKSSIFLWSGMWTAYGLAFCGLGCGQLMGWLFVVWNADSLWVGLLDKVRDRLLF